MGAVTRVAVAGLLVGLMTAGTIAWASSGDGSHRQGLRRERAVVDLLNRAINQVQGADRGCRSQTRFPREPTFTDDPPSARLLATLGVLRRPETPEEAGLSDETFGFFPAEDVYRRYVRIAHSAGGRRYLVVAARNTNFYKPRPERCTRALRRRFGRMLRGRPAGFQRAARRTLRHIIRTEWTAPGSGPREGVFMLDYKGTDRPGGGGGGGGVEFLRRRGMFVALGVGADSVVSGLLPDGVATVEAIYSRRVSRGRYRKPKRYPTRIRRTVRVQDNVVSFTVPRPAPDAFPTRMVWRSEDGGVIRVVDGTP